MLNLKGYCEGNSLH